MYTYQNMDLGKQNTRKVRGGKLWQKGTDGWLKNTLNTYKMQNPDFLI